MAITHKVETSNVSPNNYVDVHVPVINVIVNDKIQVSALLDSGSTSTFCTQRLIETLGLEGKCVEYTLSTLSHKNQMKQTRMVDLSLRSLDGSECLNLNNVYVIKETIPVNVPKTPVSEYDHLSDLSLPSVESEVDILIGQDHAEALLPLEIRQCGNVGPIAVRTILGWSLNGPVTSSNRVRKSVITHFVIANDLLNNVDNLWSIENDHMNFDVRPLSCEDKRVTEFWDKNVTMSDGHYVLPIPWKSDVVIPNNVNVAMSRLKSLKLSLLKRGLYTRYNDEMYKLFDKCYAECVPIDKIDGQSNVWYLPHHGVISDKKPDKLRIVFDCASKFKNESLNDKCYRGPDLTNKLLHVLLRFRQHQYAGMADVEAMYNQVKIPLYDRDALRFLWYDGSGNIAHYRMTSHLFGGIWCSSSSTYALRKVLEDNNVVNPAVSNTIKMAFYVDDCLLSMPSKEETLQVMLGTKSLLAKAGFKLTKFVFNDVELLSKVSFDDRANEVKELNPNLNSKALGVRWDVSRDCFYFDINIPEHNVITKRNMLSFVSSTYDPLGIVSPVILGGRLLFQEVVRLKMSWDEVIPAELSNKWQGWVSSLQHINRLKMPRCINHHSLSMQL